MIAESLMPFKYDLIMSMIDINDATNFRCSTLSLQISMTHQSAQIMKLKKTILNEMRANQTC